jgi:hypothetical protein
MNTTCIIAAVPDGTDMNHEQYKELPGVSWSSLKDLAVSEYRFWHLHINPNRPEPRTSPEMQFGSALHCAVLEPDQFNERYACMLSQSDYTGLLVTMDNLRQWMRDRGKTPKGSLKSDLIAQVRYEFEQGHCGEEPPLIWDLMVEASDQENKGKVQFAKDDWLRIIACAESLKSEPKMQELLKEGRAEAWYEVKDKDTGIILKARMDWVTDRYTPDLKTYQQKRGKSIDKTVCDAIWYEGYVAKMYFYTMVRDLAGETGTQPILCFVESEPPHETRLRLLGPKVGGQATLYWITARKTVRDLLDLYYACLKRYGDKPWRDPRGIEPLEDMEIPQQAWS